jgi:hypothetical protein
MKICSDRLLVCIERSLNKDINLTEYKIMTITEGFFYFWTFWIIQLLYHLKSLIDRLAMDVSLKCFYGMDLDVQNNSDAVYFQRIKSLLDAFANFTLYYKLASRNKNPALI